MSTQHKRDEDEKDQGAAPQERQVAATPAGMKRVRLTRSIVLGGEHAEEGSIHDVGRALAHRLIGEGSAEHHLEPGQKPDAPAVTVNRMEEPVHGDPKPIRIAGPPPKIKPPAKGKE